MGFTLPHEHLVFGFVGWDSHTTLAPFDEKDIIERTQAMIKDAQAVGVKTIIDATPADGARQPKAIETVAKQTGMNMILATGLFTQESGGSSYWIHRKSHFGRDIVKEMSELFVAEITKGIGKSGVKAGVIKVGVGKDQLRDYEKAVHTAAVNAQKETGVPIITHTLIGLARLRRLSSL
jgi:phosphotriesterase-related protein